MARKFKTGIYRNPYNGYCYFRTKKNRGRLVHRVIWEDHNGKIPENYEIHHKNGDKTDNRIENLECMSRREHMGQTHEAWKKMNTVRREIGKRRKEEVIFLKGKKLSAKEIGKILGLKVGSIYGYLRAI